MGSETSPLSVSIGKLFIRMAIFVVPGSFIVAYLWETINQALSLDASLFRLAASIPLSIAFFHMLVEMAERVARWAD